MVAYNLLLAVFPFVLLVLFVFSQILRIEGVESAVIEDLQGLFPDAEEDTLQNAINRIEGSSATLGVTAFLASLWIGASFWGAMDTAFCRIYHRECRGWVEQKRFSFLMLLVVIAFLGTSVLIPAAEGAVLNSTDSLPLGLDQVQGLDKLIVLFAALLITFLICCVIYVAVPKGKIGWRAIWPGALFVTATTGLANWLFPVYLSNVSSITQFGSTVGFVLIALVWFYALSLALMAGAVMNSLRLELHDTGNLPLAHADRRG